MKKVLYLHGKEGTCQGTKVRYLRSLNKYEVCCEGYDTGIGGQPWQDFIPGCIEKSRQMIQKFQPDLIVASSFGGGVLLHLIQEGSWKGNSVILAGAGVRYGLSAQLPEEVPTILIHGIQDDIIPLEDSIALAGSSPKAQLIALKDDHRLYRILKKTNILEKAIDSLLC